MQNYSSKKLRNWDIVNLALNQVLSQEVTPHLFSGMTRSTIKNLLSLRDTHRRAASVGDVTERGSQPERKTDGQLELAVCVFEKASQPTNQTFMNMDLSRWMCVFCAHRQPCCCPATHTLTDGRPAGRTQHNIRHQDWQNHLTRKLDHCPAGWCFLSVFLPEEASRAIFTISTYNNNTIIFNFLASNQPNWLLRHISWYSGSSVISLILNLANTNSQTLQKAWWG